MISFVIQFLCLVDGCKKKFWTDKPRKYHLVDVHKYPKDFRFHPFTKYEVISYIGYNINSCFFKGKAKEGEGKATKLLIMLQHNQGRV